MSSLKSVSVLVQKILPKLLWPIYLTLKYDLDLCMSPIKMCSLMRYICMPIMKSLSGLVKKLWTMLKLVIWPIYLTADLEGWPWPWHVCTQNVRLYEIHMHAKYEVSTCIISKVIPLCITEEKREIIQKWKKTELWLLHGTHCLPMENIFVKLYLNPSMHDQVIERKGR